MAASISEVELLQALIRFDTSNPPGNERACIEFAGGLLERAGIQHRYLAVEDDRPNLVACVEGRGEAPPLLLYGHVDVVSADHASGDIRRSPAIWSTARSGGEAPLT
jgi:acetylornithine deacetylase/succinyl-diaminopimelate desuccinylase-like protein